MCVCLFYDHHYHCRLGLGPWSAAAAVVVLVPSAAVLPPD